jgi:hypothetical protein
MRRLNEAFLVLMGVTFLLASARPSEAQEETPWYVPKTNKAWVVTRLKTNGFEKLTNEDGKRALALVVQLEEVEEGTGAYEARVFAYFDHANGRYSERTELTTDAKKLRPIPQSHGMGRRKIQLQRIGGTPAEIVWIRLHAIPARGSKENMILVSIKFAGGETDTGCDEPPIEDIAEEEVFIDDMGDYEDPPYLEEDPENPADDMAFEE